MLVTCILLLCQVRLSDLTQVLCCFSSRVSFLTCIYLCPALSAIAVAFLFESCKFVLERCSYVSCINFIGLLVSWAWCLGLYLQFVRSGTTNIDVHAQVCWLFCLLYMQVYDMMCGIQFRQNVVFWLWIWELLFRVFLQLHIVVFIVFIFNVVRLFWDCQVPLLLGCI